MKKKILFVVFVAIAMFIIFKYNDYNLNKTISACMVAQKKTSKSYDREQARKFCEKEIKKNK